MAIVFDPRLEHSCANVGHCPSLAGVDLGTVASAADQNTQDIEIRQGQVTVKREAVQRLVARNSQRQQQLGHARRERTGERSRRFARDWPAVVEQPVVVPLRKPRRQRRALGGNPGRYPLQPTGWNRLIEVATLGNAAGAFHRRYGFIPLPDDPLHLDLPMTTVEQVLASVRCRVRVGRCKQSGLFNHQVSCHLSLSSPGGRMCTESRKNAAEVRLRIVLVTPPAGVDFGIQEGQGTACKTVHKQRSRDADLTFEFTMTVKDNRDDGLPNFLGPLAQGPTTGRFVYIGVGKHAGQIDSVWERRIKVPLGGITWEMIEKGSTKWGLEARLPGTGKDGGPSCATVKPVEGWKVCKQ